MSEHNNAGSRARPKRRIMRALKINEISGVDRPAQEGARAVIMKRKGEPGYDPKAKDPQKRGRADPQTEDMNKASALTSPEEGHSHLVMLNGPPDGVELNSGFTSFEENHQHPWIRMSGGEIVLGTAQNTERGVSPHIHRIAFMGKASEAEEDDTTEKRTFTAEQRKKLAKEGKALKDGSFPIVNVADLRNALSAFGRAGNKAQVARHIKRRASALGALDLLPKEGTLASLLKSQDGEDDDTQAAGETGTVGTEGEDTMTDKTKKAADDTQAADDLQKATVALARSNSIVALSGAERTHFDALKGDETQDAFLAKSADERAAEINDVAKAAADSDPVVYTTKDGVELRKSVGAGFVAMAKANDALRDEVTELRTDKADAGYAKRAAELEHIPGDEATRVAMLKAIDGIDDKSQREAALNALKAQNESLGKAFVNLGNSGSPAPGSSGDQLEGLAKKHNEAHPDLTPEQAYDAVLKTAAGAALYSKSVN